MTSNSITTIKEIHVGNLKVVRSLKLWDEKTKLEDVLVMGNMNTPKEMSRLIFEYEIDNELISALKGKKKIGFSWNDDTRIKEVNGITIISSCDSGFGAILLEDGTVYLGCPYLLWDGPVQDFLNNDFYLYGKGVWSTNGRNRKMNITHLGVYKFKYSDITK